MKNGEKRSGMGGNKKRNVVKITMIEVKRGACQSSYALHKLYVSFVSESSLIERSGLLELRMSGRGQSDAHEIMSTLDTKQNPNHYLENSQGERKNFPTISVHIPHEGQSRDASSEVCVNQWVYMHRVLLILYLWRGRVRDTLCMWGHFSTYLSTQFYPDQHCWYK